MPSGILIHPAVWPQYMGEKVGSAVPPFFGGVGELGAADVGRKFGGSAPFGAGGLGPHLTQCGLGRGLPLYQVASCSIQPFGHNRHGPKIGGCPFWGRGAVSPSNSVAGVEAYLCAKFHLDPSNGLATIHQRFIQTDRTTVR